MRQIGITSRFHVFFIRNRADTNNESRYRHWSEDDVERLKALVASGASAVRASVVSRRSLSIGSNHDREVEKRERRKRHANAKQCGRQKELNATNRLSTVNAQHGIWGDEPDRGLRDPLSSGRALMMPE
jgi:hypothetical protein